MCCEPLTSPVARNKKVGPITWKLWHLSLAQRSSFISSCAALRSAKLATSIFVVTSWLFRKIACLAASSQALANSAWLNPAAASNTDSQLIEAVEKLQQTPLHYSDSRCAIRKVVLNYVIKAPKQGTIKKLRVAWPLPRLIRANHLSLKTEDTN